MEVMKNNPTCVLCTNSRIQYKCLICYNYDLCAVCHRKSKDPYEPNNHTLNHPMQLIKTGLDYSVCGSCQTTDFRGSRYKCMVCRDFDFCADCHRHRASTEHNSLHPMECIEKDSSKGLFCDLCNKRNYLGNQFKCLVCHNYYLCYDCHHDMKSTNQCNTHTQDHPMQILKESIDIKANGSHVASSCSSCTVQNFRGIRFKCMVCRDYDRCAECRRCSSHIAHNASHPMQFLPSTLHGQPSRAVQTKTNSDTLRSSIDLQRTSEMNSRDSPSVERSVETIAIEQNNSATPQENGTTDGASVEEILPLAQSTVEKIADTKRERLCSNSSNQGLSSPNEKAPSHERVSSGSKERSVSERTSVAKARATNNNERHGNERVPPEICKTAGCNFIGKEAYLGYCYACLRVLSRQEDTASSTEKRVFLPTKHELLHKHHHKQMAKKGATCNKQSCKEQKGGLATKDDSMQVGSKTSPPPPHNYQYDQERNICLVCLEEPYNTVLLPCGHVWLCYACAQTLMVTTKTCPACRSHVESFHRVYMGH